MRVNGPGQSPLLLLKILEVLKKEKVSYAVIGAFAASFYGEVRASLDTDIVISIDDTKLTLKELVSQFKSLGYLVVHRHGDVDDPVRDVVQIEDKKHNRVDMLNLILGMDRQAFKRTRAAKFMGKTIQIIGLEDFVAMKIFAGSLKDLSDVEGVLKISSPKINYDLLKKLTAGFGRESTATLSATLKKLKLPK